MSMLEIHRSALMEVIVPYHYFLTQQKQYKHKLFGFVEGKDDPSYYQSHIDAIIDADKWDVVLIEAGDPKGNRDRVLKLLDIIDWNRFSPKQTAFFIDRDLSDFFPKQKVEKSNLYITDYYSIENNIISTYTLKRALREIYNVNLTEKEFAIVGSLFNKGLNLVCETVKIISCYYIALRREKHSVAFGDIDIGKICNINNCEVNVISENDMKAYLGAKWHVNCDEICLSGIDAEFNYYNKGFSCIRGKYLIWYFIKFINSFCACCDKVISSMDKPITGCRDLSEQYAIMDLGVRSKTPTSLKAFIASTYLSFISENT